MCVQCKLTQFHSPRGSRVRFSGSFARWRTLSDLRRRKTSAAYLWLFLISRAVFEARLFACHSCILCFNLSLFNCISLFLARDSMLSALYAIANPSVGLSVTRVDQSKTVELTVASCNFHHIVPPSLSCLRYKFHPEIPTGSPRPGTSNDGGLKRANIVGVLTLSPSGSTR